MKNKQEDASNEPLIYSSGNTLFLHCYIRGNDPGNGYIFQSYSGTMTFEYCSIDEAHFSSTSGTITITNSASTCLSVGITFIIGTSNEQCMNVLFDMLCAADIPCQYSLVKDHYCLPFVSLSVLCLVSLITKQEHKN